ncbi:hypothetical protein [Moritella sp. F3]|uniref:hypothetical protein n=1 Tax=Moritella sp. F3 TaxID=2718882 RepID=UPI0018E1CF5A|nr:hypothetical protein [Moritella sp. F3]GIC79472.1 hypothetical protein FMO001_41990 [Moritella sp. F1]GIC79750.1 hypothetical protein FMO003_00310 [Moritella sp. F3]
MHVIKIAIGNQEEAFIENRLTSGLNVIFSDDNNRGKTLITQGLMYSIGNPSIFPNGFNFKNYYFYSKIEMAGTIYEFLRKGNSFSIKSKDEHRFFTTEAEFRYFFHKRIYNLPNILKNNQEQMIDFSLFYEMFFIGQDKRDPSNIVHRGRFNKNDFKSMLFSLLNIDEQVEESSDNDKIKLEIKNLKNDLKIALKKLKLVKKSPYVASYTSRSADFKEASDMVIFFKNKNTEIAKLKNKRSRLINRVSKLESLILELRSLNQNLSEGEIICGECKSDKIIFKTEDLEFEVSNNDVRRTILASIRENVKEKEFVISELTYQINYLQDEVNKKMVHTPPDIFHLAFFKEEILEEDKYDVEATEINKRIQFLNVQLEKSSTRVDISDSKKNEKLESIVKLMSSYHELIDPEGKLFFEDLFSKRDTVYSGSDGQEYYFCRIMALDEALGHPFPLIIDSFRDGELSTRKEEKMLKLYFALQKQVILTSTLKSEEYKTNKYSQGYINSIDYSVHDTHKLLGGVDLDEFKQILSSFKLGITT